MLQEIALSISTAIFFLCTAVVGSFLPTEVTDCSAAVCSTAPLAEPVIFDLTGVWKSGGHTFEFLPSGRLIFDGREMTYSLSDSVIDVTCTAGGTVRTVKLAYVPVSGTVMKLNGITAYKTQPQT